MRPCPVEDGRHLAPVAHLLERHLLDRRSRDNHPVETFVAHQFEILVKGFHVLDGRILRRMAAQLHERQLNLERCVRQQTHEVGLCGDFQRHQVEHHDAQRTDVLPARTRMVENEDVLFLQQFDSRQSVR